MKEWVRPHAHASNSVRLCVLGCLRGTSSSSAFVAVCSGCALGRTARPSLRAAPRPRLPQVGHPRGVLERASVAARGRRFPRVQAAQDPWGGDALRSGGRRSRPTRFWSEISRRRRFVPSFPSLQVFHQAVNLECHLAGGRSRHLSLSTCRWHIDAWRPLVPSSDPPFSPPPRPPASSAQRLVQQILSSKITVPRAAIGQRCRRGKQPIYLPKDDVSFFGVLFLDGRRWHALREGDNSGFKR